MASVVVTLLTTEELKQTRGRTVLAAALLRGHAFRECRGVELLAPLVTASRKAHARYGEVVRAKPDLYGPSGGGGGGAVAVVPPWS